jgi:hypothetical protein
LEERIALSLEPRDGVPRAGIEERGKRIVAGNSDPVMGSTFMQRSVERRE